MEDMLNVYKDRLIKMTRNRTLYDDKLYINSGFDLQNIYGINNEELINWLINKKTTELNLIQDPYKIADDEFSRIYREQSQEQYEEIEKVKQDTFEIEELNEKIEAIENKYRLKLKDIEETIRIERDKHLSSVNSISTLSTTMNKIKKETGRDELYIGYPFIEAKSKDGTFVRAPLYLFPVSISIKEANVSLIHNFDREILLNKVFLSTHIMPTEAKLADIDTKYNRLDESFIEDTVYKLNKNNINIIYNHSSIETFKIYTDEIKSYYNIGNIFIKKYTVLGHFQISNPIYTEYEELQSKEKGKLLEDFLNSKVKYNSYEYREIEEHGELCFSEKDLYIISNLDYIQEKAVKIASEAKSLVIYGPPGTGKSQTIINIISNLLAKNKSVLVISQNKDALDGIYNRLGLLNDKAIIIHDANKSERVFYEKIRNALQGTPRPYIYVDKEMATEAKDVDKHIYALENLAKVLNEKTSYGISLQEMYENSKSIQSKNDNRYEDFLRFKRKNTLKNYKYNDLKYSVSSIDESKIKSFINYKILICRNTFIEDINYKINFLNIDNISILLSTIIENIESIKTKQLEKEEMYSIIVSMLELNHGVLDENTVVTKVKNINSEVNGYLLEKLNQGKWWSFKYWKSYSKNKKQEELNRKMFNEKENQSTNKAIEIYNEMKLIPDKIRAVKKATNEKVYNRLNKDLNNLEKIIIDLKNIKEALELIENNRYDLQIVSNLTKLEEQILNTCYDRDSENYKKNISRLVEFVTLEHIYEIEEESEVKEALKIVDEFYDIVDKTKYGIEKKKELTTKYLLNKWDLIKYKTKSSKKYREFKYHTVMNNNLLPIRKYIADYKDIIFNIFPCFLLNPETLAEVVPLENELFDVVIFDDASQMYVENAIPSIFRAKQVIIAGDDKQLSLPDAPEDTRDILEAESLLEVAKVNYESIYLNYHHRSQLEELINFSNYAFYNKSLTIVPNAYLNSEYVRPILRIKLENVMCMENEDTNMQEAEMVVGLVTELLFNRRSNETIGIIAFNDNQQKLIETLLDKKAKEDEYFKSKYMEELNRIENNEDVSLFVENIENVQGHERDIIVLCTTYAKDINGRFSNDLGSLDKLDGENRLNVAISRAKRNIYVITSIEPEELSVESCKYKGPKLFKEYLKYARAVSDNNQDEQKLVLNSLLGTFNKSSKNRKHGSNFEAEVYEALVKRGYEVHTQVGVGGYKIDLAIYDNMYSRYILGIECDGAIYNSSKSARERDIHRHRYLESRGWRIIRIWSQNWWRDPTSEIEKIENLMIVQD